MEYTHSFAKELGQLATGRNSGELPQDVYNYIKSKVISAAEHECNEYMSALKQRVSRGEYQQVNGKRVISYTLPLRQHIDLLDNRYRDSSATYWLSKLSRNVNANTLRANGIILEENYGYATNQVNLLKKDVECKGTNIIFGVQNRYTFDIQKGPFADLYFNTLKENLRKNGINYHMTLEFYQGKTKARKSIPVKKYDITANIPHIHESFVTPRADTKIDVDTFGYKMNIEITVYF